MAWFVYIVECKDKSFYTGITWNLEQRVKLHNDRRYKSFTTSRLPVRLVYWEKLKDRFDAASREKIIKGWSRLKKQQLIDSLRRVKRGGE